MMTLSDIRGTAAWLTSRIDLRTERRIRKVLRTLERAADARLVVVWMRNDRGDAEVIASAGDFAAMPACPRELESTKPSYAELQLNDGSHELAVTHQVVVGRRIAKLALVVIAPGVTPNEALLDLVERTAEAVEEVVVDAVDDHCSR